jgi:hypothetical protein
MKGMRPLKSGGRCDRAFPAKAFSPETLNAVFRTQLRTRNLFALSLELL